MSLRYRMRVGQDQRFILPIIPANPILEGQEIGLSVRTISNLVASDLALSYQARQAVLADLVASYGAQAFVSADLAASYATGAFVQRDLSVSYDADSDVWLSAPAPSFTIGAAGEYDLTQHLLDSGIGITLSATPAAGTLPTGVTVRVDDGDQAYVYDGNAGATTETGVQLDANAGGVLVAADLVASYLASALVSSDLSISYTANADSIAAPSVNYVQNTSGNDDYGHLTALPNLFGDGEFTYEMWVKPDDSLPVGSTVTNTKVNWSSEDVQPYSNPSWWYRGNFLLDGHNNGAVPNGTFSLQVVGGGRIRWLFGDGAAADARVGDLHAVQAWPSSGAASLLDGAFHKIVCVRRWDGGTGAILELWIDGTMVASETTTARTNMATAYWDGWSSWGAQQGWFYGAEKFSALGGADWEDYKGLVSEVGFFNRAKTATELANDWNRASTPGEEGLVGLFRHDEGSGTTVAQAIWDDQTGGNITLVRPTGSTWANEVPFSASEQSWRERSASAEANEGWSTRFDTDKDVYGDPSVSYVGGDPDFYRNYTYHPNLTYSSPGNLNPRIYRQQSAGIAGRHCMRQEHYASDNLQMGGWRRLFVDGQSQWPLDVPLYVVFHVKLAPSKYNLGSFQNNSWKVGILAGWGQSGWGSSNNDRELAMQNTSDRRIIQHYTQGSPDLVTNNFPQAGDIRYQNQRDRGASFTNKYDRYCLYNQYNTGACILLQTDVWLGMYYRVVNRAAGRVDIDISYAYEGDTDWTLLERYVDYGLWGTDEFNTLTMLSYTTARTGTASQSTHQDVSEIIVSKAPIACRSVWS